MRIASLLPSATEIICGLGLREQLVGVSHECDYPPCVAELPVLTQSRIPTGLASQEIDRLVSTQLQHDEALYSLKLDTLNQLAPDLIVSQALCDVCAVSGNDVVRALGTLPGAPQLVNLEPTSLGGMLETVRLVAEAAGCLETGEKYIAQLQRRIDQVAEITVAIPRAKRPRVAMLDWLDPLFDGGHWCAEMIELAGGVPCLGEYQTPSRRRSWNELCACEPDVLFIALCGFDIARSMQDIKAFAANPEFAALLQQRVKTKKNIKVFLVDGNAYFSRSGPRLVDSLEIMAHALHPDYHLLPEGFPAALDLTTAELLEG